MSVSVSNHVSHCAKAIDPVVGAARVSSDSFKFVLPTFRRLLKIISAPEVRKLIKQINCNFPLEI